MCLRACWALLQRHAASAQAAKLYSRRSDRSVSLLSSCVPDLSFDGLAFYLDAACGKLYPDGTLALQVELIPGEAGQQVTLAYT